MAPSGVQKERILPSHASVTFSRSGRRSRLPQTAIAQSACTPLFWNALDLRGAGSFSQCCDYYIIDAWEHVQDITPGRVQTTISYMLTTCKTQMI
jgi:hypothetical protein